MIGRKAVRRRLGRQPSIQILYCIRRGISITNPNSAIDFAILLRKFLRVIAGINYSTNYEYQ